jgi:hypothetical protein
MLSETHTLLTLRTSVHSLSLSTYAYIPIHIYIHTYIYIYIYIPTFIHVYPYMCAAQDRASMRVSAAETHTFMRLRVVFLVYILTRIRA